MTFGPLSKMTQVRTKVPRKLVLDAYNVVRPTPCDHRGRRWHLDLVFRQLSLPTQSIKAHCQPEAAISARSAIIQPPTYASAGEP